MRSSVTVAFTPRVLESSACVNTLFTSVLGLLSHTQPGPSVRLGWCADMLLLSALQRSPALDCVLWVAVCASATTRLGTSIPHWPGGGDFILTSEWKLNRWSEVNHWSQRVAAATWGRTSAASGPYGVEKGRSFLLQLNKSPFALSVRGTALPPANLQPPGSCPKMCYKCWPLCLFHCCQSSLQTVPGK